MDEIISRELIAQRAEQDAIAELSSGRPALCPYPFESEAALEWRVALMRNLVELVRANRKEGGA